MDSPARHSMDTDVQETADHCTEHEDDKIQIKPKCRTHFETPYTAVFSACRIFARGAILSLVQISNTRAP